MMTTNIFILFILSGFFEVIGAIFFILIGVGVIAYLVQLFSNATNTTFVTRGGTRIEPSNSKSQNSYRPHENESKVVSILNSYDLYKKMASMARLKESGVSDGVALGAMDFVSLGGNSNNLTAIKICVNGSSSELIKKIDSLNSIKDEIPQSEYKDLYMKIVQVYLP